MKRTTARAGFGLRRRRYFLLIAGALASFAGVVFMYIGGQNQIAPAVSVPNPHRVADRLSSDLDISINSDLNKPDPTAGLPLSQSGAALAPNESALLAEATALIPLLEADLLESYKCDESVSFEEYTPGGCSQEASVADSHFRRKNGYATPEEFEEALSVDPDDLERRAENDARAAVQASLAALRMRNWLNAERWALKARILMPQKSYPYWLLYWSRMGKTNDLILSTEESRSSKLETSFAGAMSGLAAAHLLGDRYATVEMHVVSAAIVASEPELNIAEIFIAAYEIAIALEGCQSQPAK